MLSTRTLCKSPDGSERICVAHRLQQRHENNKQDKKARDRTGKGEKIPVDCSGGKMVQPKAPYSPSERNLLIIFTQKSLLSFVAGLKVEGSLSTVGCCIHGLPFPLTY